MNKFLFLMLITCLFSCAVKAQDPEQDAVMMKMLDLKNGLLTKDSVLLSRVLADDVSYGHSNGMVQTKAQLIRDVVSGIQVYNKIEPADFHIRLYNNTAIVNMFSFVNMVFKGKTLDMSMNLLLVWVKKNGEWKLEARQSVLKS